MYETMKLRLLNGSHSAFAYLGQLLDIPTVWQAAADPLLEPAGGEFALAPRKALERRDPRKRGAWDGRSGRARGRDDAF